MILKNKFKLCYTFIIGIIYICNVGLANEHFQVNFILGENCVYPDTNTNVYEVVASGGNLPYESYTWENATPISSVPKTATTAKNNKFSSGSKYIRCTVEDHNNIPASATKKVSVIACEMTIFNGGSDLDNGEDPGTTGGTNAEVPDDNEESVGAYLLVNWDDDDGDGVLTDDGWQTYPVPDLLASETSVVNEDNLARLSLSTGDIVPPSGIYELEVTDGEDKIKLWTASTKSSQINLSNNKITWDLSDASDRYQFLTYFNHDIWIEGIEASDSERDVELVFRHCDDNGTEIMSDTVKATVVMLKLGAGLYRNMGFPPADRGHTGLLTKFNGNGDCTPVKLRDSSLYTVHEMQKSPSPGKCNTPTWKDFYDAATYWNEYSCTLTYVQRLKILKTAKWVESRGDDINYAGTSDVLLPESWNKTIKNITGLRCDGLVEFCYEWNNISVWGHKPPDVVPHYSIKYYTEEHNDIILGLGWYESLYPATQCAHEGSNPEWDTKFNSMDIIEPSVGLITW